MNLELHLRLAGALQIALAAAHVFFPTRFHWKEELPRLSLLNRQMFVVHTIFICLVVLLMGALSFFAPHILLQPTALSRLVLAGFAAFWGLRLAIQLFVYDSRLWRRQAFNTLVHVLFTAMWMYLTAVYAGVLVLRS